jgi:predicted DNA binding protein
MPEQRWTMYVCEDCGGMDSAWEMFLDDGWHCSEERREHGTVKKVEVIPTDRIDNAIAELEKRARKADRGFGVGSGVRAQAFREAIALLSDPERQE